MFRRFAFALALLFFVFSPAEAQVTIGDPVDGNCFPFGCIQDASADNDRYQQVYHASNFTSFESVVEIDEITFFLESPGDLNQGTFDFYLSNTFTDVGDLSPTMDDNPGANESLFGSYTLGGAAPSTLSFSGDSFTYDPFMGNLLLDIRITDLVPSTDQAFYEAEPGSADATEFSRMHNFNGGFEGYGLVTQFNGDGVTVPEPATALLFVSGVLGLAAIRRREDGADLD